MLILRSPEFQSSRLHGFMASAVQAYGADGGTLGPQDGSSERGSLPAPYPRVPEGQTVDAGFRFNELLLQYSSLSRVHISWCCRRAVAEAHCYQKKRSFCCPEFKSNLNCEPGPDKATPASQAGNAMVTTPEASSARAMLLPRLGVSSTSTGDLEMVAAARASQGLR